MMILEKIRDSFYSYYTAHYEENDIKTIINDFCNFTAESYEEYTALWEILADSFDLG